MNYNTSSSNYENVITCLYYLNNYGIAFNYYTITNSSLQKATLINTKDVSIHNNGKYIKATLLPDRERLFIGWLTTDGIPYYWMYDINDEINTYSQHYFIDSYCKLIPHGFKIDYYPENPNLFIRVYLKVILGLLLMQIF